MFSFAHMLIFADAERRSGPDQAFPNSWWHHQMETFSVLLALHEGNSPAIGGFPSQRPVTWGFGVLFALRLNKQLSKQSRRWWFETPSRPLWRHCNAISRIGDPFVVYIYFSVAWGRYDMETHSVLLDQYEGNLQVNVWLSFQRTNNAKTVCNSFVVSYKRVFDQTIELSVIWEEITHTWLRLSQLLCQKSTIIILNYKEFL